MNELSLPANIDQRDVYLLLAKAVSQLTGGGSSSVPVETAKELIEGICFHIRVGAGAGNAYSCYERGVAQASGKARRALGRFNMLSQRACDYGNITLRDTLEGLKAFFKRYNPRLYPLQTPGDIDYQLASPLPSVLAGADYILEYVRRLSIEESFVGRFDESGVRALLHRYSPECDHLAINVFDMVFANAAGKAMLGKVGGRLLMTRDERDRVINALYARPREEIARATGEAARFLSRELRLQNADSVWYLNLARDSLAARLYQSLAYSPDGEKCALFLFE